MDIDDAVEKIITDAKMVKLKSKCRCSWCRKEIEGVACLEPFLAHVGFIFCSPECIRKTLKHPFTEKALSESIDLLRNLKEMFR